MTIDELKAAAKLRTRKMSTDELDEDVFRYVDFALADLKRIGVAEEYLKAPEDPLIIEAVLTYVKANYSMDANHERFGFDNVEKQLLSNELMERKEEILSK